MSCPSIAGEIPAAASAPWNRDRRSGSAMIALPIWAPAMLKVLVAAVSVTISGRAIHASSAAL